MAVPNIFASATTSIPLSQLDANFAYFANAITVNYGSTLMTLDASGKVGIGVAPAQKLTVSDGANNTYVEVIGNSFSSYFGSDTSGTYVGNASAQPVRIITNSGEVARFFSGGSMSIGLTSNYGRLSVQGANTGTDYCFRTYNSTPTALFAVRNDGAVYTGAGANSPYNLTTSNAANGYLAADGFWYRSTSSLRYKQDVKPYNKGIAALQALNPVSFKSKREEDGSKEFAGFIAEDVHAAGLTEFVVYDKEDRPDALHYGNMTALLAKALQEAVAKIEALESRIAKLEGK